LLIIGVIWQFDTTNKTDRHDITEILLKVALNTIKPTEQRNDRNTYFIKIVLDQTNSEILIFN
jgi:hypothetical protein